MNHFFGRNPHAFPLSSPSMHPRSRRSLSRTVAYLGLQPSTSATHDAGTVAFSIHLWSAATKSSSVYCTAKRWLSFLVDSSFIFKHFALSIMCRISYEAYKRFYLTYVVNDKRYIYITSIEYHVLHTIGVFKHDNRNKMDLFGMWEDNLLPECRPRNQRSDLYTVQESNFDRNT